MTNSNSETGTSGRLIAAVDFETFYDAKAGYSLTNMTPYEYVRDPRFNAYLVAVAFNDGRPTFVGNPKNFDWSILDDALLLAHNAAFDGMVLLRLEELGVVPKPKEEREWLDTADMVAFLGVTRNLKTACRELLDLDVSKAVRSAMDGKTDIDLNRDELEALYEYGGSDAEECLQLFLKYGDKWPQIERDISTQTRNAAWRGINVNDEAVVEGINVLSVERDKAAAQLPWVARGEKPGSLPALADEVKKLGLPVPPSFRKNDPRFLEWQEKYKDQCPFLQARIVYAGTTPHIARLQNLHDHLNEGMYHSDVRYFGTHCLSAGHQVLTKKGWVKIEDWVKVGDDILQWDPASQRLAGFLPAEPFEADNTEDKMIEFKSNNVRCKMTLGHKVPVIIHEPRNKTFPTKTVSMTAEGVYRTVMRGEDLRVAYVSPVALTFDYGNDIYNHMRTDDTELNSSDVRFVAAEKKVYCAKTQTGFFICRYMGTVFVSGNTGRTASGSNGGRETETASKINLLNLPKAPIHGVDMRGMFIPRPGHKFIIYDYGQIEARVIKWLAGDSSFVADLKKEGNIYGAEAVRMGWAKPGEGGKLKKENKELYQLAKACALGLGYSMGPAKFIISCRSMGLHLDPLPKSEWPDIDRRLRFVLANQFDIRDPEDPWREEEVGTFLRFDAVVSLWRRSNPKIVQYWAALERSLRSSAEANKAVHYFQLPSGRFKPYFRPSIKPELKAYIDPETGEKKTSVRNALTAAVIKDKPATFFHGGSLAENITQATARDIMAQCAVDVERMHPSCKFMWSCYDEIIFEVPEDECEEMNKRIPEIMCHGPSVSEWIDDNLPLEVEGGIFDRYCK